MIEDPFSSGNSNPAGSPPPAPDADGTAGESPSPAVPTTRGTRDVLAKRREQIERYGHTPAADARRPIHFFAIEIDSLGNAIREDSQFGVRLPIMRRHAVNLAAFALALIDRIDAEPSEELPPL